MGARQKNCVDESIKKTHKANYKNISKLKWFDMMFLKHGKEIINDQSHAHKSENRLDGIFIFIFCNGAFYS